MFLGFRRTPLIFSSVLNFLHCYKFLGNFLNCSRVSGATRKFSERLGNFLSSLYFSEVFWISRKQKPELLLGSLSCSQNTWISWKFEIFSEFSWAFLICSELFGNYLNFRSSLKFQKIPWRFRKFPNLWEVLWVSRPFRRFTGPSGSWTGIGWLVGVKLRSVKCISRWSLGHF